MASALDSTPVNNLTRQSTFSPRALGSAPSVFAVGCAVVFPPERWNSSDAADKGVLRALGVVFGCGIGFAFHDQRFIPPRVLTLITAMTWFVLIAYSPDGVIRGCSITCSGSANK
jgi:hypothetical protein